MSHTTTVPTRLAGAVSALALLGVAALGVAAEAGAAIDPSASAVLAGALKPQMQKTLAKKVPGLVVTRVTCFVPTTSKLIAGKCTAKFSVAKARLLGTYQTTASMSSRALLKWSTTSVACTDSKTHKRIRC
jgi:hypothetical protein